MTVIILASIAYILATILMVIGFDFKLVNTVSNLPKLTYIKPTLNDLMNAMFN